jgi:hypothetical protein
MKPVYITTAPYNTRALMAIDALAAETGMNKSQAAVHLVMLGAGLLKPGLGLANGDRQTTIFDAIDRHE